MQRIVGMMLVTALVALDAVAADPPQGQGWVVLPVDEYRSLLKAAHPPELAPARPPLDATVTQIEYDLRVSGDSATGTARLTVDVLKDGWGNAPVPGNLLIREMRIEGAACVLADEKDGKAAHLFFSKPGRSTVILEVAVPVSASAGTETISLPTANAALMRAVITMPQPDLEITVSGGMLLGHADSPESFIVCGTSDRDLDIFWRRRLEDRTTLPLRLRASVVELVGIGEDGAQISAEVGVEVVQGAATSVSIALGASVVVNQVSGATVSDWEQKADRLEIELLEPAETSARFVVNAEARMPREGLTSVPLMRIAEAERETGSVAVDVLGAGEITNRLARGLDDADPSELGESFAARASPSIKAFRFRPQAGSAERALTVTVARYTPEAVVLANIDEARYEALISEEGKLLVRARFAVRNNQRSFLALRLPPGATLWSAAVSGRPVRPGQAADGSLLLPLEKKQDGDDVPGFPVEIVYMEKGAAWTREGRQRVSLPALDLQISRSALVLRHSPRFTLKPEPGAFRVEPYAEPASGILSADIGYDVQPQLGKQADARTRSQQGETPEEQREAVAEVRNLLDQYRREGGRGSSGGIPPIRVPFPEIGSTLYLVSELTTEGVAPVLEVQYKQTSKGEWK